MIHAHLKKTLQWAVRHELYDDHQLWICSTNDNKVTRKGMKTEQGKVAFCLTDCLCSFHHTSFLFLHFHSFLLPFLPFFLSLFTKRPSFVSLFFLSTRCLLRILAFLVHCPAILPLITVHIFIIDGQKYSCCVWHKCMIALPRMSTCSCYQLRPASFQKCHGNEIGNDIILKKTQCAPLHFDQNCWELGAYCHSVNDSIELTFGDDPFEEDHIRVAELPHDGRLRQEVLPALVRVPRLEPNSKMAFNWATNR